MTNYEVCEAFAQGKKAKCLNMHTDGERLFSYATCIAERATTGHIVVNLTKYSVSTSKHQNNMRNALYKAGLPSYSVTDIPMGTISLLAN